MKKVSDSQGAKLMLQPKKTMFGLIPIHPQEVMAAGFGKYLCIMGLTQNMGKTRYNQIISKYKKLIISIQAIDNKIHALDTVDEAVEKILKDGDNPEIASLMMEQAALILTKEQNTGEMPI